MCFCIIQRGSKRPVNMNGTCTGRPRCFGAHLPPGGSNYTICSVRDPCHQTVSSFFFFFFNFTYPNQPVFVCDIFIYVVFFHIHILFKCKKVYMAFFFYFSCVVIGGASLLKPGKTTLSQAFFPFFFTTSYC